MTSYQLSHSCTLAKPHLCPLLAGMSICTIFEAVLLLDFTVPCSRFAAQDHFDPRCKCCVSEACPAVFSPLLQGFDKQGFPGGTPPPFNLPLASASQAGPLGAPAAPYGTPFLPMMPPQPHSQTILHHPLQQVSQETLYSPSPFCSNLYSPPAASGLYSR